MSKLDQYLGNPNLKPESGQKINLSFEYSIYPSQPISSYNTKLGGFCKIIFNGFSQLSQNFIHLFPFQIKNRLRFAP